MSGTVEPGHFEALYAAAADPWRFATSAYEQAKYDDTIAALGPRRFDHGFEAGCSIGVLTRRLAARCDTVLAVDLVEAALQQARARCIDLPTVRFARMRLPEQWPDARFDLIVLSELLYFFGTADAALLAARVEASLRPGGVVLLVHWLGDNGAAISGDAAVERFITSTAGNLTQRMRSRTDQYRLDLLEAVDPAR